MRGRKPFIIANWKMNDPGVKNYFAEFFTNFRENRDLEVGFGLPFTLLGQELRGVLKGAQNCHEKPKGPFTGEISANMLKTAGCDFVIIGHSERRQFFGEKNEVLEMKVRVAHDEGLRVVFCIGETHEEREAGKTLEVIAEQLAAVPPHVTPDSLVIAYEPVWAIGTGIAATPQDAETVHRFIRSSLSLRTGKDFRILYGGSLTDENAKGFATISDVDGGLIGGASLDPKRFIKIIDAFRYS